MGEDQLIWGKEMRISDTYTKQDKTIFIWKLNLDGTLQRIVVENYRVSKYPGTEYFLFKVEGSSTVHSLRASQLDRFVNGRYASFTNDDEKAIKAIEANLSAKVKKLKDDYESVETILELLRTNN